MKLTEVSYFAANWREEQSRVNRDNRYFAAEHDKILMWGRMPELYYFSERLPASRFITCNFVVGMTTYNYLDPNASTKNAGFAPALDWLLSDLVKNRPRIIIDSAPANIRQYGKYPISSFPGVRDFVRQNYHLATTILNVQIYEATF